MGLKQIISNFTAGSMTYTPAQQPLLYLASASPRRQELLAQVSLPFALLPQKIDEAVHTNEAPQDYVLRMAREKAQAALQDPECTLAIPVLAADTTVVCHDSILGKPADMNEAVQMLTQLSGRRHQVMTAIAIATRQKIQLKLATTEVHFRTMSPAEMTAYWQTGECHDKAGAYAIQGKGAMFISRIEGSYSNVVGLPLFETMQLLASVGISAAAVLAWGAR
jgi:septum formation protein